MVVNYGVRPLGTSVGGVLGSTIGVRPTLWIATVGALAGLLFVIPSPIMSLHEVPEVVDALAVEQSASGVRGQSRLVLLVVLRPDTVLDGRRWHASGGQTLFFTSRIRHQLCLRYRNPDKRASRPTCLSLTPVASRS